MSLIKIGYFSIEFPYSAPFKELKSVNYGGVGKSLLDLISNIDLNNYIITIFSIGISNKLEYESPLENMELYRYPAIATTLIKKLSITQNFLSPRFLFTPIKKEFDLIHCQYAYPGTDIAALNYKKHRKTPLLLSIREIPLVNWGSFLRKMSMKIYKETFYEKMLKSSDKIVIQSEQVLSDCNILKKYREKIEVVPNGVDFKTFSRYTNVDIEDIQVNLDQKIVGFDNILLFVGSLVERKGISTLIKMFEKILKKHPNTLLIIAGDGSMKSYVLDRSTKKGYRKNILFMGYIDDKEKLSMLYAASDLFILPSLSEGFPRVILEAMSAGTPCLVSDIGANIGALNGGQLGLVAKVSNPEDFADKVIGFIEASASEKKRFSKDGIKYAKSLSWKDVARKMEQIYEGMLNN